MKRITYLFLVIAIAASLSGCFTKEFVEAEGPLKIFGEDQDEALEEIKKASGHDVVGQVVGVDKQETIEISQAGACSITGRIPDEEYDPFDACNVAQWTAYAMVEERQEVWFEIIDNSLWPDWLRYVCGYSETEVANEIWENKLLLMDTLESTHIKGSWECDFWAPEINTDDGQWVLFLSFIGEDMEGNSINFIITYLYLRSLIPYEESMAKYLGNWVGSYSLAVRESSPWEIDRNEDIVEHGIPCSPP